MNLRHVCSTRLCLYSAIVAFVSSTSTFAQETLDSIKSVDESSPWDLPQLFTAPNYRWETQTGPIREVIYQGEKYQGRETEVFAYFASPKTLGTAESEAKFPGVVLIHGGGGTAFAEWVYSWASRGYAAIAMDLAGSRPPPVEYDAHGVPRRGHGFKVETRSKLDKGGPNQSRETTYDTIGGSVHDDWPYHAVANAIRAHSLLRDLPDVVDEAIGVTGISWGGYTTCMVASLDHRFRAAVPVYGAGFFYKGDTVQRNSFVRLNQMNSPTSNARSATASIATDLTLGPAALEWVKLYEASERLMRCRVPILFVNGTNDKHNPLDNFQSCFELIPGEKAMRVEAGMVHSHPAGWAPPEIFAFIDSHCRKGIPLPLIGLLSVSADDVNVDYQSATKIAKVELHFTSDVGERVNRRWEKVDGSIENNKIRTPLPPASANTWYVAVTDERGYMVSSDIQFSKKP